MKVKDDPLADEDNAPLLTADEIEVAKTEARDRVRADAVKAARKDVVDKEIVRLKRLGSPLGEGAKDELVTITLDLAEHSNKIVINGEPFWHGHTYTRPRHVVDSMREQMLRGWNHQDQLDGRSLDDTFRRRRLTTVNGRTGNIQNAAQASA